MACLHTSQTSWLCGGSSHAALAGATSLTVTGKTAVWSGTGRFNGVEGYRFTATVVDNGQGRGRKSTGPDTFSLVVTAPDGTVVMTISGPLGGGNLKVH